MEASHIRVLKGLLDSYSFLGIESEKLLKKINSFRAGSFEKLVEVLLFPLGQTLDKLFILFKSNLLN
jgi:hypothetical protein